MTKAEFIEVITKPNCRLHSKGRKVAELVFVDGLNISDAARQLSLTPQSAGQMIKKFRKLL
jgi:hypothetical protein